MLHTHCKTQSYYLTTSNAKNLNGHSFLLFFCLRQPSIFALNVFLFKHPHSFHDGLPHVHPHGSNYCLLMVCLRFDPLHSSIYNHNHIPFHLSSWLPIGALTTSIMMHVCENGTPHPTLVVLKSVFQYIYAL